MTLPFFCVAIAWLLIYLPKWTLAIVLVREKNYNNKTPRDQQAQLEGWRRRAVAAHLNSFEAFAPFAAGVMIAHLGHASTSYSNILALTFVGARTLYPILYIANIDKARSAVWSIATGATVGLLLLPLLPA